MKNERNREMFVDLYRMAEYCEDPPFKPGDIEGNGRFFDHATREIIMPFLKKYESMPLAGALVMAIWDDCSNSAAEFNKM